jgi:hypothetical protein
MVIFFFLSLDASNNLTAQTISCEFCGAKVNVEEERDHLTACAKFKVPCPNRCGAKEIRREEVPK